MPMPKLWWLKCLLFPLPLLVILAFLENRLDRRPNLYTDKKAIIERQAPRTEVLVSGSSHAFYGIDPAQFDRPALNLGCVSQDVYYDTRLTLKYAPQMPHLKLALVDLSWFSLTSRLDLSPHAWRTPFYNRVFDIPTASGNAVWTRLRASWLWIYGPRDAFAWCIGHSSYQHLPSEFGNSVEPFLASPAERQALRSAAESRKELKESLNHVSFEYRAFSIAQVGELCATLQHKGVKVVFVTTPLLPVYLDAIPPKFLASSHEDIARIAAQHGVAWYDYSRDNRFADDDFYDCSHLSGQGARKFSHILNEEVIRKYLPAP